MSTLISGVLATNNIDIYEAEDNVDNSRYEEWLVESRSPNMIKIKLQ